MPKKILGSKRVMIVGAPGSGKSTLAAKLGEVTGLSVFHMDKIHYKSGWVERRREDKSVMTHEVHQLEEWIFEGGHSATYEERFQRADTFIWLDFPVGLRVFRVLKRTVKYYGQARPDLPDGCPERFNKGTLDFLVFIWRTRKSSQAKLQRLYEFPSPHVKIRLTNLKAVEQFLERTQQQIGMPAS